MRQFLRKKFLDMDLEKSPNFMRKVLKKIALEQAYRKGFKEDSHS